MNGVMRERRWLWIGGALLGLLGVALARLVAPELAGLAAPLVLYGGITLVFAGITVLAFAARRRPDETYIAIDRDAGQRSTSR
jgi:uncharacterized membrane protein HdeD (DUF308 family)